MKAIIFCMIVLFVLQSCSSLDGKIVKREYCESNLDDYYGPSSSAKRQYLINTSKSKIIIFTVKRKVTSNHNRGVENQMRFDSRTEIYTLNPGEEKQLECEEYVWKGGSKWDRIEFEIVGRVVK